MEFHELIEKHFSEVITGIFSVLGTILGTVLGAVLVNIFKRGKLKLIDVKSEILQSSTTTLEFLIDLSIYNSADNIKSIKDLTIEILCHGRTYSKNGIDINGEEICHYNFNPKQITKISTVFKKEFQQNILKGDINKVIFIYRTTNGTRKQYAVYENYIQTYLLSNFWTRFRSYVKYYKNNKIS
jgi:hypothetical protein